MSRRVFSFWWTSSGSKTRTPRKRWRPQFAKYNQTLKALRSGLGLEFDTETYWTRTRGDPSVFLTPNAEAREALRGADAVSLKKLKDVEIVLTNCAEKQAKESLAALGLLDAFDGVFGADAMGDTCKPFVEAFRRVQKIAGFDYAKTAFFEDSLKNLAAAKTLGATTVLVASATAREEGTRSDGFEPDHVVAAVTPAEMARVLPGVFLG